MSLLLIPTKEFLLRLLGGIAGSAVVGWLSKNPLPLFTTKGRYIRALEDKIRQMPFIYKDLDGQVYNDFVDIEFKKVHPETYHSVTTPVPTSASEYDKLRQSRKILMLGSAGIGKTTFQRHSALQVIKNKRAPFLHASERVLPIYIPLKLIDNSAPLPIFNYILTNLDYFSGSHGRKRLSKLANAGRIFLCIDGYDEIPFTGAGDNYVQKELVLIFFAREAQLPSHYPRFNKCRTWLSSRKEFYERNSIRPAEFTTPLNELLAVELRGIGNNRIKLARVIFDKYKRNNRAYIELLSEELFIATIDSSGDAELHSMSFNPLFLTVMCYIYVNRVYEAGSHLLDWTVKIEDLILETVKLLLQDLDRDKARDLPAAHRAALMLRRNAFFEEKLDYLHFFATTLYLERRTVFRVADLQSTAQRYFANISTSQNRSSILERLATDPLTNPDFVSQLIYCGIFVLVDRNRDGSIYDFPHRRFKEVLASQYICQPSVYASLLPRIEELDFTELVQVLRSAKRFQDSRLHDKTLQVLLESAFSASEAFAWDIALRNFFHLKPAMYDPTPVLGDFFLRCLVTPAEKLRLPTACLENISPAPEFVSRIKNSWRVALDAGASQEAQLCGELLQHLNPALFEECLATEFGKRHSPLVIQLLLRFEADCSPSRYCHRLEQCRKNRTMLQYLFCAAERWLHLDSKELFSLVALLETDEQVAFAYICWRHFRAKFYVLAGLDIHQVGIHVLTVNELSPIREASVSQEPTYIFTEFVFEKLRVALVTIGSPILLQKLKPDQLFTVPTFEYSVITGFQMLEEQVNQHLRSVEGQLLNEATFQGTLEGVHHVVGEHLKHLSFLPLSELPLEYRGKLKVPIDDLMQIIDDAIVQHARIDLGQLEHLRKVVAQFNLEDGIHPLTDVFEQ